MGPVRVDSRPYEVLEVGERPPEVVPVEVEPEHLETVLRALRPWPWVQVVEGTVEPDRPFVVRQLLHEQELRETQPLPPV